MVGSGSEFKHIVLDESGNALIGETTMKVRELVAEHLFYGWQPLELARNHDYLTLSQIYAALAYYHEHQAEVDAQIKADLADVAELRRLAGESLLARKLRQDRAS
jgi:uncharacterized protein (DUF433 family)